MSAPATPTTTAGVMRSSSPADGRSIYGYLAEYATPGDLLEACKAVRDAGYKKWDSYSPFAVHGSDAAMGIRPTILPWLVLGAGLTGLLIGISMQIWMNGIDYPWIISGKPLWSVPAFVPVAFELTILLSALTTFGGALVLNKLPDLYHPLFKQKRFAKVTDNKFFIAIEAEDKLFDGEKTRALLERTHPAALEAVPDDRKVNADVPRWIRFVIVSVMFLSFIPMVRIAQARYSKSEEPRIHLIKNMDHQEKYNTQNSSPLFADNRSMREPIAGTVAQDELLNDDLYTRGVNGTTATADFPPAFQVTAAAMTRGKQRFEIYCQPCHGAAGYGDGMVARRAAELAEGTWVAPTSLHEARLKDETPGHFFNVISNGVRNMPGYASQIPVQDRWAITLYIKALQNTGAGPSK